MYICQLKDIDEAVCTGYFDVASRMINNLIQEIEETNEQHEWIGLTDEDIKNAVLDDPIGASALMSLMRDEVMVTQVRQAINRIAQTIEAKLKEKNT